MKRYYLAGPEVFWPDAVAIGNQKKAICRTLGLVGVFPLDNELDTEGLTPYKQGLSIFDENVSLMRQCDGVIANMTPFRGPSIDVGTAFEMGFMHALGKPVYGYSNDHRFYSNRVPGSVQGKDADGFAIEQFDMADNLMLVGSIERSGGYLYKDLPSSTTTDVDRSLALFEEVVKLIQGEGRL